MKPLMALLSFALVSCASLSKEECSSTDWVIKGEQDARAGKSISRYTQYHDECQEKGISIPKESYVLGHNKGLEKFCTYNSGYSHGEDGLDPFTECDKIGPSFSKGYEEGLEEKKKKQEEELASDREETIKRILSNHNDEKCTFDSDCIQDGDCSFNKCRHDGSECNFDSDCEIEGDCSTESAYLSHSSERVSVNVCKY